MGEPIGVASCNSVQPQGTLERERNSQTSVEVVRVATRRRESQSPTSVDARVR